MLPVAMRGAGRLDPAQMLRAAPVAAARAAPEARRPSASASAKPALRTRASRAARAIATGPPASRRRSARGVARNVARRQSAAPTSVINPWPSPDVRPIDVSTWEKAARVEASAVRGPVPTAAVRRSPKAPAVRFWARAAGRAPNAVRRTARTEAASGRTPARPTGTSVTRTANAVATPARRTTAPQVSAR